MVTDRGNANLTQTGYTPLEKKINLLHPAYGGGVG